MRPWVENKLAGDGQTDGLASILCVLYSSYKSCLHKRDCSISCSRPLPPPLISFPPSVWHQATVADRKFANKEDRVVRLLPPLPDRTISAALRFGDSGRSGLPTKSPRHATARWQSSPRAPPQSVLEVTSPPKKIAPDAKRLWIIPSRAPKEFSSLNYLDIKVCSGLFPTQSREKYVQISVCVHVQYIDRYTHRGWATETTEGATLFLSPLPECRRPKLPWLWWRWRWLCSLSLLVFFNLA